LKDGGTVFQKTDDKEFFLYSKDKFIEHGFKVIDLTELLNQNKIENVETEYEKKFRAQGMIVYGLKAEK
jgi:tRNA G46 methylase TrmB